MAESSRTYRLDPPDRTGVLLGLSAGQMGCLGAAVLGGSGLVAIGAPLPVVALMSAALIAVAFVRVGPSPLVELTPTLWRWVSTRGAKRSRWLAPLPLLGDDATRLPVEEFSADAAVAPAAPHHAGAHQAGRPVGEAVQPPVLEGLVAAQRRCQPVGLHAERAEDLCARATHIQRVTAHVEHEAVPLGGSGPSPGLMGLKYDCRRAPGRGGSAPSQPGEPAAHHDDIPIVAHGVLTSRIAPT